MPFVFVLASVEGGVLNVTAMKVKNASVLLPDFVTFLRHVCKCLIIKGRSRCFG